MAFNAIYGRVFAPITPATMSTLQFVIPEATFIDWDLDPLEGAADDMFEVSGRKASVTVLDKGQFGAWIHSKQVNAEFPEYMNGIILLNDAVTNAPIIKGCVKLQSVKSDYDAGTVTFDISDALDVYIDQAKKLKLKFTQGSNAWSRTSIFNKTLYELCYRPIAKLGLNMSQVTMNYDVSASTITKEVTLPNYTNNFSQWNDTHDGVISISKIKDVKYIVGRDEFWVNLLEIVNYGNDFFKVYHKFYKLSSSGTQVIYSADDVLEIDFAINVLRAVGSFFEEGNVLNYSGSNIVFSLSNPTDTASNTLGAQTITLAMDTDTLIATYPLMPEILYFNEGEYTYAQVLNAMLTANRLHVHAHPVYGLVVINSVLSGGISLTGGTVIPDSDIIDQRREGTYADVTNITDGLSICSFPDGLIQDIQTAYRAEIEKLSAKLSFTLPESYHNVLDIFTVVSIDAQSYLITSIGYPQDGFIDCEAIGEWN